MHFTKNLSYSNLRRKKTNLWCPLFVYFPLLQNWVDYECLFINGLWLCEYIFDLLECLIWVFYIVLSQRNAYTDITEREIVCVCVCVCVYSCSSVSGLLPTCCRASGRHFVMGHPELDYSHTLFFSTVFSLSLIPSHSYLSITHHRWSPVCPSDFCLAWRFYRIQSANGFWFRMVTPFLILSIQFIVGCFKCVKLDLMYPVTSSFFNGNLWLSDDSGGWFRKSDDKHTLEAYSHDKWKYWDFKMKLD